MGLFAQTSLWIFCHNRQSIPYFLPRSTRTRCCSSGSGAPRAAAPTPEACPWHLCSVALLPSSASSSAVLLPLRRLAPPSCSHSTAGQVWPFLSNTPPPLLVLLSDGEDKLQLPSYYSSSTPPNLLLFLSFFFGDGSRSRGGRAREGRKAMVCTRLVQK
jgi:hypothetical protein